MTNDAAVLAANRAGMSCYFCGTPSDGQVCAADECQRKAGATLRADLDFHAALWANIKDDRAVSTSAGGAS